MPASLFQRLWRRFDLLENPAMRIRKILLKLRGMQIGDGTVIPKCLVTWPHQVKIGKRCILQPDIFFNYDHYWTPGPSIRVGNRIFIGRGVEFNIKGGIDIGDDCLIASGCIFVDSNHGVLPDLAMNQQPLVVCPIKIGNNAWIGARSIILKGVTIGEGSVIGAGSVVTKSIPAGEIWVGNPARFKKKISESIRNFNNLPA